MTYGLGALVKDWSYCNLCDHYWALLPDGRPTFRSTSPPEAFKMGRCPEHEEAKPDD